MIEDYRVCDKCGKKIHEGFCIEWFVKNEYYCSKECLLKDLSWKEYLDMYDSESAYWTQWN